MRMRCLGNTELPPEDTSTSIVRVQNPSVAQFGYLVGGVERSETHPFERLNMPQTSKPMGFAAL
ncbi:MAG: hypothetical protein AB1442_13980, partial [Nitrospirota bacterium]